MDLLMIWWNQLHNSNYFPIINFCLDIILIIFTVRFPKINNLLFNFSWELLYRVCSPLIYFFQIRKYNKNNEKKTILPCSSIASKIDKIYVPHIFLEGESKTKKVQVEDLFFELTLSRRLLILGSPGSGKSILLRYLIRRLSKKYFILNVNLNDYLVFRNNNANNSMKDYLCYQLDYFYYPQKFLISKIKHGNVLLLIDGFDKVIREDISRVIDQIKIFFEKNDKIKIIAVCNPYIFEKYHNLISSIFDKYYYIRDFDDVSKYHLLFTQQEKYYDHLMVNIKRDHKIEELTGNPLVFSIIVEFSNNSSLPWSRAELYKYIMENILKKCDNNDEMLRILKILAYRKMNSSNDYLSFVIVKDEIDYTRLPEIILEILEQKRLLTKNDGGEFYLLKPGFTEFCAALYLMDKTDELIKCYKTNHERWREVVILACGLLDDCTAIVQEIEQHSTELAMACIAESKSVDSGLEEQIFNQVVNNFTIYGESEQQGIITSLGILADDCKRGENAFRKLRNLISSLNGKSKISALKALAASYSPRAVDIIFSHISGVDDLPLYTDALIRLGDLSVDPLLETLKIRTEKNYVDLVFEILMKIGTPRVGIALNELLWKEGPLQHLAAHGLKELFRQDSFKNCIDAYKWDNNLPAHNMKWLRGSVALKAFGSSSKIIERKIVSVLNSKEYGGLTTQNQQ